MSALICNLDGCNLRKLSADLEPTPFSGQRDELISSFCVMVYLYHAESAICK